MLVRLQRASLRPNSNLQEGGANRRPIREREQYIDSASLAYEDGYVCMSGPSAEWL